MSEERIGELSKEIVEEWYEEKGVSPEESESQGESKEEREKREEKEKGWIEKKKEEIRSSAPDPGYTPLTKDDEEELKEREKEKELLVKNKVKDLLRVAEEKGLERSIKEAEKENDPFLLDVYHDVLAKDAAYKKFLKK